MRHHKAKSCRASTLWSSCSSLRIPHKPYVTTDALTQPPGEGLVSIQMSETHFLVFSDKNEYKSFEHDLFAAAVNCLVVQLAHFTNEKIGQDKPIYIPFLEERENLVKDNSDPHWATWCCVTMLHSAFKTGKGESLERILVLDSLLETFVVTA